MTQEWKESDKILRFRKPYQQPVVHDTPHEENADNVRYSIHHLAKPVRLYRYNNPAGYVPTGIPDRGEHTEFKIWMEIQPISGEETKLFPEGERSESKYEFWFEPYHPKQITIDGTPLYLRQADSRFLAGDGTDVDVKGGHGDIIHWMGENYIIRKLENWASSSHEEAHGHNTGYQWGIMQLWRDHYNERERNRDNDQFEYNV